MFECQAVNAVYDPTQRRRRRGLICPVNKRPPACRIRRRRRRRRVASYRRRVPRTGSAFSARIRLCRVFPLFRHNEISFSRFRPTRVDNNVITANARGFIPLYTNVRKTKKRKKAPENDEDTTSVSSLMWQNIYISIRIIVNDNGKKKMRMNCIM